MECIILDVYEPKDFTGANHTKSTKMHKFTSRKVEIECESFWYATRAQQIHSNMSSSSLLYDNYTSQSSLSKWPQINNFGHHQTKNFHEYILNLDPLCKLQRLTRARTYRLETRIP